MTQPLITIVSPFYNEAAGSLDFCQRILAVLDSLAGYDSELICVDDGSRDDTLAVLNKIAAADVRVKVLGLSRNFGQQSALIAGLEAVHRDSAAVIMMDSDLQHPPEMIPALIEEWKKGFEVVSPVRTSQSGSGAFKRLASVWYYRILSKIADIPITPGTPDFCLLDAKALNAVLSFEEQSPYLRGIIAWIGFKRAFVPFAAPERLKGTTQYSLAKMMRLASDGIFAFSVSPMRVSLKAGCFVSSMAAIYLIYALGVYASNGAVRGWTSLLAAIVFFGGVNLVSVGLVGEYLGRTFQEVKKRPRYILRQGAVTSFRSRMLGTVLEPAVQPVDRAEPVDGVGWEDARRHPPAAATF